MTTVDLTDMEITTLPTRAAPIEIVHDAVPMMDEQEARACVTRIKTRIDVARGELLELHDREGWRALGYKNWETCARQEFGGSAAQMYRLLSAAQIERALDSPIGEYPESHLREVAVLDSPADQRFALEQANIAANGRPTAKEVRRVVQAIKPKPAPAELAQPDLPIEYDIIKRRYERHGYTLSAAWDGVTQRFVVRKDGGTGAVMAWPDVLSRLERLESEPSPPPPPPLDAPDHGATDNAAAYAAREQADLKLIMTAENLIANGSEGMARALLSQVQVATYRRDQVLEAIPRAAGRSITLALRPEDCAALLKEARFFANSNLTKTLPTIGRTLILLVEAIKAV